MRSLILLFLLSFAAPCLRAEDALAVTSANTISECQKPNPVWFKFLKKQKDHKKLVASVLAFPLPFGILGIHRLYLGTEPYVPLIYVGTLGGCAGLLPLIDFIILVSNKDISRFKNDPHVFMWVDNEAKK